MPKSDPFRPISAKIPTKLPEKDSSHLAVTEETADEVLRPLPK
jgi:hypothetical protein